MIITSTNINPYACSNLALCCVSYPGVMHIPSHTPFAACHCRSVCGSIDVVDGSAAAKLQQMAHELAACQQGKNALLVWNRALPHQLAAQAYCQAGMHSLYYTLNFLDLTAVMVLRQACSSRGVCVLCLVVSTTPALQALLHQFLIDRLAHSMPGKAITCPARMLCLMLCCPMLCYAVLCCAVLLCFQLYTL